MRRSAAWHLWTMELDSCPFECSSLERHEGTWLIKLQGLLHQSQQTSAVTESTDGQEMNESGQDDGLWVSGTRTGCGSEDKWRGDWDWSQRGKQRPAVEWSTGRKRQGSDSLWTGLPWKYKSAAGTGETTRGRGLRLPRPSSRQAAGYGLFVFFCLSGWQFVFSFVLSSIQHSMKQRYVL